MNDLTIPKQVPRCFPMGLLCLTDNVWDKIPWHEVLSAVIKHLSCHWSKLDPQDQASNEAALINGGRIFSSHCSSQNIKFWIITEADRSATTVLLPQDY